jgi:hypothetical protein
MNKILTLFVALICSSHAFSQDELYGQIRRVLALKQPDLVTSSRLIAFNSWSAADAEGREINKELDKTYKTFEFAKLKGGQKGMVAVSICTDGQAGSLTVLNNDGVRKLIPLTTEDIKKLDAGLKNGVFDSSGQFVYKNLEPGEMFTSVQKLITR